MRRPQRVIGRPCRHIFRSPRLPIVFWLKFGEARRPLSPEPRHDRRVFAVCLLLAFAAAALSARAADSFAIGVMNDQSGPYADLAGPGSVEMARMAIADFGGSVLGKPIELLVADHQNKVDVGLSIARNGMTSGASRRFSTSPIQAWRSRSRTWPGLATGSSSSIQPRRRTSPARRARPMASSGTPTIGRTASR